ncbi:MAG: hypothetical protein KME15_03530 [Drouetiella hepatica Uher 2000/2452]|jgi:uncharacterized membrane protein|uniref:Uncharacterized protein n=1 Tax=Drouetiella hepatica Uher 2000/2452 TaxID=904376 RepID=A0A951Q9I5_9CYAN|nr:hypothetical protein [Drouetiella hepatica Uher 2000/2452]
MWQKLIQATAITSALYLVMGMSKPPMGGSTVQFQLSENLQHSLNTFNAKP